MLFIVVSRPLYLQKTSNCSQRNDVDGERMRCERRTNRGRENSPYSDSAFQNLEYMRSYLIGKMGWSAINGMPNVSGGFGLFDRSVAIAAGGYDAPSFAEDMDLITRMVGYMCDFSRPYKIVQIPDTCCWTEGPPNLAMLYRQRTRWARGLFQTLSIHHKMIFKKTYKQMGLLTLPYMFILSFWRQSSSLPV